MHTFEYFESSTRGILNILKMFHHFRQMFNEITTHEMPHHSIPFPPFPLSLIFPRITQFSSIREEKFCKNSFGLALLSRFSRATSGSAKFTAQPINLRGHLHFKIVNRAATGDPNCKFRYNNAAFVNIFSISREGIRV